MERPSAPSLHPAPRFLARAASAAGSARAAALPAPKSRQLCLRLGGRRLPWPCRLPRTICRSRPASAARAPAPPRPRTRASLSIRWWALPRLTGDFGSASPCVQPQKPHWIPPGPFRGRNRDISSGGLAAGVGGAAPADSNVGAGTAMASRGSGSSAARGSSAIVAALPNRESAPPPAGDCGLCANSAA
jgi:hypothetical protein